VCRVRSRPSQPSAVVRRRGDGLGLVVVEADVVHNCGQPVHRHQQVAVEFELLNYVGEPIVRSLVPLSFPTLLWLIVTNYGSRRQSL